MWNRLPNVTPQTYRGHAQTYNQAPTQLRIPSDSTNTTLADSDLQFLLQEAERQKARLEDEYEELVQVNDGLVTQHSIANGQLHEAKEKNHALKQQVLDLQHQLSGYINKEKEPDVEKKLWYMRNGIAFLQEQARESSSLNALKGAIASFDTTCETSIDTFNVQQLREELANARQQIIPKETFQSVVDQILDACAATVATEDNGASVPMVKYQKVKERYREAVDEIKQHKRKLNAAYSRNNKLKGEIVELQQQQQQHGLPQPGSGDTDQVMVQSELDALRRTKAYHEQTIQTLEGQVSHLSKLNGQYKENNGSGCSTPREREKQSGYKSNDSSK